MFTIGLFSFLILSSFVQMSDAELQELIIDVSVEKGIILSGDSVVVTGKVVNHGYEPIKDAEVLIRTGTETVKIFSDQSGVFKGAFTDFQKPPGIYTVNVIASWHEMTGLTSTQFQIKGDVSLVSELEEKLSTDEAKTYLSSKESDYEKNPIGQILFKHYHGLLDKLLIEQKVADTLTEEEIYLEQQRKISEDLRQYAIEEYNPGYGVFDGYSYETYVANLNPEIKDLAVNQLEFTKNIFENAQKVREEIIANGGTIEQARQAYLEMLSIPKETLEEFNQIPDEESEISDDAQTNEHLEEQ